MARNLCLLVVMSAFWATPFVLVKIAEESIAPFTVMVLRALGAGLLLWLVAQFALKRDLRPLFREWKVFLFMGLMGIASLWICTALAEEWISASLTTLMSCLIPVFTFLITALVLRSEPFAGLRLFGALLAVAGVGLFVGPDQLREGEIETIGVLIMALGFLCLSINGIFAKAKAETIDPFVMATGTIAYGAGYLVAAMVLFEAPFAEVPTARSLLAVLFGGLVGTGVGYLIFFYLIATAGPLFTSLFGYLMPIFAIFLSNLLLGEAFTWGHLVGLVITLAGAYLVNRRPDPLKGDRQPA